MNIDTKLTLTALFAACIVTANVTATKIAAFDLPVLGSVAVPAGFVAFGAAYLVTDLLNELYGPDYTRKVVNGTIVAMIVSWGLIYVSIAMDPAPFYGANDQFTTILGGSATVITASLLTILVSQNLDVIVFDRIKQTTGTTHKWMRNIGSTTVSQLIDTVAFIGLGFYVLPQVFGGDVTPLAAIPGLIFAQYVMKLVIVGLDTPFFYVGSAIFETETESSPTG